MNLKILSLVGLLISLSACSKSNLIQERQKSSPPMSQKDVGILLNGASETQVVALLKNHKEARVRTLNPAHGLFEIFGLSQEQVSKEFSGHSEPNQFFKLENRKPVRDFSLALPGGFQIGNLNRCKDSTIPPNAIATAELPIAALNNATIEIGQKVRVHSRASAAAPGVVGALKTVFDVLNPEMASRPEQLFIGDSLEFTPDTLGLYRVFTIVQDSNEACALDVIDFVVTANRQFEGKKSPDITLDLSKFTQLSAIHAEQSWSLSEGEGMVIAIIDTGINYNHESLADALLVNPGEIPENGLDDDSNGFIDDYLGYDFANQDHFPYDDESHGTHVAGLAAGRPYGIARKAQILAVKAMTPAGGDLGTVAAAIHYAVDRKANIINLSLGAAISEPPVTLKNAFEYAQSKGVLIVTAAGNGDSHGVGIDIDKKPVYPASFIIDNNLAVAAYDSSEVIARYSNFGLKSVALVAPGGTDNDFLFSAAFENPDGAKYIGLSGTSMAAPIVAGVAAQVWSKARHLGYKDVRSILLSSGSDEAPLKALTISGKHLDSLSAVQNPADN